MAKAAAASTPPELMQTTPPSSQQQNEDNNIKGKDIQLDGRPPVMLERLRRYTRFRKVGVSADVLDAP